MCSSQRRESAIGSWEFKGYNILLLLYKHIYVDILLVLILKEMQFSHQTAKLEGYLMLNMNLSNYNLIKYQSSIDFFFINTKVQKEKAFQTKQTKAN